MGRFKRKNKLKKEKGFSLKEKRCALVKLVREHGN